MTVRTRLIIVTVFGLALTMLIWGWIQLRALDKILVEQTTNRLYDVAETVSTYYQHFPTRQGLSALDNALKEHVQSDMRLARIDLFSINDEVIEYIAGAGRISYEWPENSLDTAADNTSPQYMRLSTENGPALGLLYPIFSDNNREAQILVGVIVFTQSQSEILSSAKQLLMISSFGLLIVILTVMALSYRWLIGRPLSVIINTIDEFQTGHYVKRIPLVRADEWGQLAAHFNSMADEIEQVLARNLELTRRLEDRVQEATHKAVQLQNQVNQLQQLTALGYLTATLAHDLGTPLHSIAGLTELLLERGGWQPDVARKLELIVQQTQRLNTVIQNVRRATRLPELHVEATHVDGLLNDTLPLIEPLVQKSGSRIIVKTDADIPLFYIDRYRVQTALFNLIQNAVEALPAGGEITISAHSVPEQRTVAISVKDNGPGIPPELMARVCEPFFSTHADEGLRGLGLAIVQDIVKAHGGHIEIKSQPNEGTVVTLYFQAVELTAAGENLREEANQSAQSATDLTLPVSSK
jgi:two-component system NtrC family sensor kinase